MRQERRERRPVLIGLVNPYSTLAGAALLPVPRGCAGWRLWQFLGDGMEERGLARPAKSAYVRNFQRRNILADQRHWDRNLGRALGPGVLAALAGRVIVALGAEAWSSLVHGRGDVSYRDRPQNGQSIILHVAPQESGDEETSLPTTIYYLPHPSGRNPWYNEPENRRVAATLLTNLYCDAGEHIHAGVSETSS